MKHYVYHDVMDSYGGLAVTVVQDAHHLFTPENAAIYGWKTWTDCIQRGLDRIQKYFPELLID